MASRERLFVSFFTTKPQGLGLGLAISRDIVDGFGGRLRLADSRPGLTRFELWLPAA